MYPDDSSITQGVYARLQDLKHTCDRPGLPKAIHDDTPRMIAVAVWRTWQCPVQEAC